MSTILNPYRFSSAAAPNPFENATRVLALYEVYGTVENRLIMRIYRSSDGAFTNLFFDDDGQISNSSGVYNGSTTYQGTDTLGNWGGTDDITVQYWYFQKPEGVTIESSFLSAATATFRFTLSTGGVIETENGHTALKLDGTSDRMYRGSGGWDEIRDDLPFTVAILAANYNSTDTGFMFNTQNGSSSYFGISIDRRTQKRAVYINSTTDLALDLPSQVDSADERLIVGINDGSLGASAYYNGSSLGSGTFTGAYTDNFINVGYMIENFEGSISMIATWDTDQTANINEINTGINDIYGIY